MNGALTNIRAVAPDPATIKVGIRGKTFSLSYEKAFQLGTFLLNKKRPEAAAKMFERLMQFTDRGPRAAIMRAYCEAAARRCEGCSAALSVAFPSRQRRIAEALHNAFVSYHIGMRDEAVEAIADLCKARHDLPSVCLLLGDMFAARQDWKRAKRCWSLSVERDAPNGAVALVTLQTGR
jgi:hypothetical protein